MLIYKQRYKPRTSREFTKSDLTVYDSAGNTALNALTVYGKSEVVGGSIVSAGEGYAIVDLGTLSYVLGIDKPYGRFYTPDLANVIQKSEGTLNLYCALYKPSSSFQGVIQNQYGFMWLSSAGNLSFSKNGCETAADFKSAMSGVLLCYQEATPTNNAIAIKTDNGSGIDGTMATFSTGTPLRGIPDTTVRDVMVWDGTSGEVTKNCGVITLNGSETWKLWEGNAFYCNPTMAPAVTISNDQLPHLLSSYLSAQTGGDLFAQNEYGVNVSGATIRIRIENINNTSDLQTYLQSNPLTFVYELATPTTEQLTSTENASIAGLRTFAPNTHAQNNANTDMTVDYTIRVPTI